ncbi:MAG: hypothetical protein J6W00_01675 [Lentisphaeria bacterium]|nr:hypothetical protein [Lentisphaeria bacterium]
MRSKAVLDGVWDFVFFAEDPGCLPESYSEVMPVPGCFDLMEPYCGQRGFAFYRREVECGGLVKLFIDGLGITAEIFWDGKSIGKCPFAYMPEGFVFDSGDQGKHELVIKIDNRHNEMFQPFFDFYGYGGVYGPVTLENVPENYIYDVFISTEDYKTGKVRVRASVAGNISESAALKFDDNEAVECRFENGSLDVTLNVPDFKLWSTESPALHNLTITTAADQVRETFGIRTFETAGRKILLNGKEIKFRGYNRHESHPEVGASTSMALMASDLRLLKEQGGNFFRGSHYPQRRAFLEMCDRMGVLVWEETLGWGIKAPLLHEPEYLKAQIDQVERMTRVSFNHPCIAFRGFLNENDCSVPETRNVIKTLYDAIRAIDEHCLITFASNKYENDCCTDLVDVVSMNPYPGWYDATHEETSTIYRVQSRLEKLSDALPADKPFIISEIGSEALLGFRDPLKVRWSEEYQAELAAEVCRYIEREDCAGVAFWMFCDTRSYVTGPAIYYRPRGFNNKGMLDEYRRPKLAWDKIKTFWKK